MSFLKAKFLKSLDESNFDAIRCMIKLDRSLLMIRDGESTILVKLTDMGFNFEGFDDLTMVALNSLRYPKSNKKILQEMLNPSEKFFINLIDENLEDDFVRLVENTKPAVIGKVFPKILRERHEQIFGFRSFSFKKLSESTLRSLRIEMDDPPEDLFKIRPVDVNEIDDRRSTPRETMEFYLKYGKGILILTNKYPDDETSEVIKIHKQVLNFSDPKMAEKFDGNSDKSDLPPYRTKVIQALEMSSIGINVNFENINADIFSYAIMGYLAKWNDSADSSNPSKATDSQNPSKATDSQNPSKATDSQNPSNATDSPNPMRFTETMVKFFQKKSLDTLVHGILSYSFPKSFLEVVISKKYGKIDSLKYLDAIYVLFGNKVQYLVDRSSVYKEIISFPVGVRKFLSTNMGDTKKFATSDPRWVFDKDVVKMYAGVQPKCNVKIHNIVDFAAFTADRALSHLFEFRLFGLIISLDYNYSKQNKIKTTNFIIENFFFSPDKSTIEDSLDSYGYRRAISNVDYEYLDATSYNRNVGKIISDMAKGMRIRRSEREAIEILKQIFFEYLDEKYG